MKNIYSDPYSRTAGLAATPMSDSVNARVLAADTAETSTPPSGAVYAIITPTDGVVCIKPNGEVVSI